MTHPNNLLGDQLPKRTRRLSKLEKGLADYDKESFTDRVQRLKLLDKIFPKGHGFMGQMELIYTFGEAKYSFINGQFIGTIILAQSFVEKVFHGHFAGLGLDVTARKGLSEMIKYGKKNKLINEFILDKADKIRKIRNPFTHLKDFDYPHGLAQRIYQNRTQPYEQLEKDAEDAIRLMIFVATHKF